MSSGIEPDWNLRNENTQWIKVLLSRPVAQPGKNFKYDSLCTYLLSALITKVTGMSLLDYLKIKLFAPMNIREVEWEKSPEGYNTGGWGLYIQSESLAKFGLLLQHEGRYKGRQLIPSAWVREMMRSR
jgi:CubicO group peptidase (beta-lactamase class C family)